MTIPDTIRTPDTLIDDDTELIDRYNALLAVVEAQRRDWEKLNMFLIATAISNYWCSDFERRMGLYNSTFEVLQLHGRASHDRIGARPDQGTLPACVWQAIADHTRWSGHSTYPCTGRCVQPFQPKFPSVTINP